MQAAAELHEEVLRLEGRVRALEALLAVLVARLPEAARDAAIATLAGIAAADAIGGAEAPDAQRIAALVREGMAATAEAIRRSLTDLAPEEAGGR
jgi:uncharacterized protein with PhoU and TrkA domain